MWRVCKQAGRPWPTLSSDDVVDYAIMESIALKVAKEDVNAQKTAEREDWKKDTEGLARLKQHAN